MADITAGKLKFTPVGYDSIGVRRSESLDLKSARNRLKVERPASLGMAVVVTIGAERGQGERDRLGRS